MSGLNLWVVTYFYSSTTTMASFQQCSRCGQLRIRWGPSQTFKMVMRCRKGCSRSGLVTKVLFSSHVRLQHTELVFLHHGASDVLELVILFLGFYEQLSESRWRSLKLSKEIGVLIHFVVNGQNVCTYLSDEEKDWMPSNILTYAIFIIKVFLSGQPNRIYTKKHLPHFLWAGLRSTFFSIMEYFCSAGMEKVVSRASVE